MANNDDELKRIAALTPNQGVRTVNKAGLSFHGSAGDAQAFNSAVQVGARPQEQPRSQPVRQIVRQAAPVAPAGDFRNQLLTKANAPKGMGWQERMAINEKIAANHGVTLSGQSSRAQEAMTQAGMTGRTRMEQQGLDSRLATTNAAAETLAQTNARLEQQSELNKQALTDKFSQGKEKRTAGYAESAAQAGHGRTMSLEEYKTTQSNAQANETQNKTAALEVYKAGGTGHDAALFRNGATQPGDLQGLPKEPSKIHKLGPAIIGRGGSATVPSINQATGAVTYSEVPQALGPAKTVQPTIAPINADDENPEDYKNRLLNP